MTPYLAILPGYGEWVVVVLVVVLLFGATKIPQIARALGRAKGDFERGKAEGEREAGRAADEADVLRRARELGIPTDGRDLDDVRKDVAARNVKA